MLGAEVQVSSADKLHPWWHSLLALVVPQGAQGELKVPKAASQASSRNSGKTATVPSFYCMPGVEAQVCAANEPSHGGSGSHKEHMVHADINFEVCRSPALDLLLWGKPHK